MEMLQLSLDLWLRSMRLFFYKCSRDLNFLVQNPYLRSLIKSLNFWPKHRCYVAILLLNFEDLIILFDIFGSFKLFLDSVKPLLKFFFLWNLGVILENLLNNLIGKFFTWIFHLLLVMLFKLIDLDLLFFS
jgi:hypothetical protein